MKSERIGLSTTKIRFDLVLAAIFSLWWRAQGGNITVCVLGFAFCQTLQKLFVFLSSQKVIIYFYQTTGRNVISVSFREFDKVLMYLPFHV